MNVTPFQQRHRQPRHVRVLEQQPDGLLQGLQHSIDLQYYNVVHFLGPMSFRCKVLGCFIRCKVIFSDPVQ